MDLRDQRQIEFAKIWLKTKFGILYLCPRFGKIRTSIKCLREFWEPKVLIIHPIETIKKSWQDDFVRWGYDADNVEYCTTASLWKLAENPKLYDVIIMDEVQLFSPANLQEMKALINFGNKCILGLSGTISAQTAHEIRQVLGLPIVASYSIEEGIKEKVITDYEITVITTYLDGKDKYIVPSKKYPDFKVTELDRYIYITNKIEEIKEDVKKFNEAVSKKAALQGLIPGYEEYKKVELGLLPLHRMHVLKKSRAKLRITKELLKKFANNRVLVFCGVTDIADSLGIPVFHSKNKDQEVKDAFCSGQGNALATVDMFEAGVTIKPINCAILNSFDSNPENLAQRISRLTGFEYDNPQKIAKVYIICTNTVEKDWLDKALEFFDLTKVNYHESTQGLL